MRKIDFLSQSPSNYIFQKESNKTTFGGVLSIFYIYTISYVLIYYIAIYTQSLPYDITSFVQEEKLLSSEQRWFFLKSGKYNPNMTLAFKLLDNNQKILSDRFIMIDAKSRKEIKRYEILERRVSDIHIYVFYKCLNQSNCNIDSEDISPFYRLIFFYQNFYVNPQGEIPIDQVNKNIFSSDYVTFSPEIKMKQSLVWNIIRFENSKGLFDIFTKEVNESRDNDSIRETGLFIGGKLKRYETTFYNKGNGLPIYPNTSFLMEFEVRSAGHSNAILYEEYKRKKISFFDYLPDIFSLWISIYNAFTFLFSKLYSSSFDKYKIIDNILSKQKEKLSQNKRQKSQISIINDINQGDFLFENDSVKESKELNLISNANSDESEKANDYIKKKKQERILPKKCCCDFICNSLCCCCSCVGRQKLINNCKDIILKYYSMENIIYNQIMMENLLQDYNWNNPELNNLLNNKSLNCIQNNIINIY